MYYKHTVAQSLPGIVSGPLQVTSSSSTGFEVGAVGRDVGDSVVDSGFVVGVGFGLSSSVEAGVLGGLSHSG